ncbi:hypothetical protein IU486_32355 [Streptomyces gardneri]|uniref:hypothetical protein n=1 Tax=Nocardia TaxID=1817 RepID=UPI00135A86AA|nr:MULTISPECIES: hypothetical protein [Nocardia]MBF6169387.1 hypothetical protein [Streptomyces gardneri]MBF6207568.1 hypothetical protein [Streptomyces gardneri]UAK34206.1 hypothetical protein K8O92_10195 [Nocardia asteroides]
MTQWLPLFGSLIVAVAALVGVLVNNRTNRAALTAADERNRVTLDAAQRNVELTNAAAERREHDKWRRESVLSAVSSVLAISSDVRLQLLHCDRWEAEELDQVDDEIRQAVEGSRGFISSLRVVAHRKIPNRCEDLMRTLTAALNISLQRRRIELDGEATAEEISEIQALWSRAIENTVEEERSVINATRLELEIKISAEVHQATPQPALARS